MSKFHALKISDVRRETPDVVSLAFQVTKELAEAYRFQPGQYLTLRTTIGSQLVQRAYSICSGLDSGELRVAIKRVSHGWFSNHANEMLRPGQRIDVMPPKGRFGIIPRPELRRSYLAFAAGSGITPIMSVVHSVLRREPRSEFSLFYGNRDSKSILFEDELNDLKSRYMERFSIFHILSREGNDVQLFAGRLGAARVMDFSSRFFDISKIDVVFVCGPGQMNAEISRTLVSLGVSPSRIRKEMFVNEGASIPRPPVIERAMAGSKSALIETIIDGTRKSFPMEDDDRSIIDAGHRNGVELPFSCKGGMCCTCRAKVIEGSVAMGFKYSLEPWEEKAGFVLTCQARPTSDHVVLDFDHV